MSNFDATMETSLLKQSSEAQCSLQGVRTYPFTSHNLNPSGLPEEASRKMLVCLI